MAITWMRRGSPEGRRIGPRAAADRDGVRTRILPWVLVVVLTLAGTVCIAAVAVSLVPWSSLPGAGLVMDAVERALVPVGETTGRPQGPAR